MALQGVLAAVAVAGLSLCGAAGSSCRNTGTNLECVYTTVDLDGQRRMMSPAVDRGAYEFVEATPPVITSAVIAVGVRAPPFHYRIAARFAPTNFAATGLPAGLAVDSTNGVMAGLPVATGLYALTIIAANPEGACTGQLLLCVAATNLVVVPHMTESSKTIVTRTKDAGGVSYATARRGQTKCVLRARCDLPIDFTTWPREPFVLACGDLHLTLCFTNFTVTSGAASYTRTRPAWCTR